MSVLECVWGLGSGFIGYYKMQNGDNPMMMASNIVIILQPLLEKNRNS